MAMKHLIIFAALAALSACAATNGVQTTKIVEKDVPVAVQPIKPSDVPSPPAPLGKRPPSAQQAADAAFSGYCAAIAYIIRAAPLLAVSAGLPPIQAPIYPECEQHR